MRFGAEAGKPPASPRLADSVAVPSSNAARLKLAGDTPQEVAVNFDKMHTLVTETHERLLTSPSPEVRACALCGLCAVAAGPTPPWQVRRAYLGVVRRLVSYVRTRYGPVAPEHAIDVTVTLINQHCVRAIRAPSAH